MLAGRLGLETARVPHADRFGLLWLSYGNLTVEDGSLHFIAAKSDHMEAGDYAIPFQMVSMFLLGPGTTISHDAIRLCARHGCEIVAVGENGTRLYSAQPLGPNESIVARKQALLWANESSRLVVARRMYAIRMGEFIPNSEIAVLRGMEGARMKEIYKRLAQKFSVQWNGRIYDRQNPDLTDLPNMAINHVVTAIEAAAHIAVAATASLPQLGFIHEDSSNAFCLDIADLYRHEITIPVAFEAVNAFLKNQSIPLERVARSLAGKRMREKQLIHNMIGKIKELIETEDGM